MYQGGMGAWKWGKEMRGQLSAWELSAFEGDRCELSK